MTMYHNISSLRVLPHIRQHPAGRGILGPINTQSVGLRRPMDSLLLTKTNACDIFPHTSTQIAVNAISNRYFTDKKASNYSSWHFPFTATHPYWQQGKKTEAGYKHQRVHVGQIRS